MTDVCPQCFMVSPNVAVSMQLSVFSMTELQVQCLASFVTIRNGTDYIH